MATSKRTSIDDLLTPLTSKIRNFRTWTYDVESKDLLSQEKGFQRAFLVSLYDGATNHPFRNQLSEEQLHRLKPAERAIAKNGCVDRFLRYVTAKERQKIFCSAASVGWAHNQGRFDGSFILTWLARNRREWEADVTSIQGRAQRIVFWRKGVKKSPTTTYTLCDSLMLLRMSLDEAARTFSPDHAGKEVFDLDTHEDDPRWEVYNERDCVALYNAIEAFRKMVEELGGEVGTTAPSTAIKLFRRKFLKYPILRNRHFPDCDGKCRGDLQPPPSPRPSHTRIKVKHQTAEELATAIQDYRAPLPDLCKRKGACDLTCHGCLHAFIRRGYVGGRTEMFATHAPKGMRYFDRNSSYPASMKAPMPVGKAVVHEGDRFFRSHQKMAEGHVGFVDCDVEIPEDCVIPSLPLIYKGKLVFPTGRFSGVFDYDELKTIFDPFVNGTILRVRKAVWFEKRVVYDEFVDSLYAIRRQHREYERSLFKLTYPNQPKTKALLRALYEHQGEAFDELRRLRALSELAKLMLNSAYGKHAMEEEREELTFIGPDDPWPDGPPLYGKPLDGQHDTCPVWRVTKWIDAKYIVPQMSAHITSLSRVALWDVLREIVLAGGVPYYCDTDSAMASIAPPDHLLHDETLGMWKDEYPGMILSAKYVQPKMYSITCWDSENDNAQILWEKFKMKGVKASAQTRENFEKLVSGSDIRFRRTTLHRTILKTHGYAPEEIEVTKALRSSYDKRIVLSNGSTRPLHVNLC